MSISVERAQRHIAEQGKRLAADRQHNFWPKFLFHTTHVTNAVRIVKDGFISARNSVDDFHDVANPGALSANTSSHDNARLYFRPKNGFHLRTEGIKCRNDPYRQANQMSVPVCFVFRLSDVVTRKDTLFSAGNAQRSANAFQSGDSEFDKLDFNAIYHDSWFNPEDRDYIMDCRMAEVSVKKCLPLAEGLHAILFRTKWDSLTFLHQLGLQQIRCGYQIGIEQVAGSLFLRKGLFLTDVGFIDDKIELSFHFPDINAPSDRRYEVCVQQQHASGKLMFDQEIEISTPNLSISNFKADAASVWTINLEKELAFQGVLKHAQSELFG